MTTLIVALAIIGGGKAKRKACYLPVETPATVSVAGECPCGPACACRGPAVVNYPATQESSQQTICENGVCGFVSRTHAFHAPKHMAIHLATMPMQVVQPVSRPIATAMKAYRQPFRLLGKRGRTCGPNGCN